MSIEQFWQPTSTRAVHSYSGSLFDDDGRATLPDLQTGLDELVAALGHIHDGLGGAHEAAHEAQRRRWKTSLHLSQTAPIMAWPLLPRPPLPRAVAATRWLRAAEMGRAWSAAALGRWSASASPSAVAPTAPTAPPALRALCIFVCTGSCC